MVKILPALAWIFYSTVILLQSIHNNFLPVVNILNGRSMNRYEKISLNIYRIHWVGFQKEWLVMIIFESVHQYKEIIKK